MNDIQVTFTCDPDTAIYLILLHSVYSYGEHWDEDKLPVNLGKLCDALSYLRDILSDLVDRDGSYAGISSWTGYDWDFMKNFIFGKYWKERRSCRERDHEE